MKLYRTLAPALLALVSVAAQAAPHPNTVRQSEDMNVIGTNTGVGAATLLRTPNTLSGRIMVNVDTAGAPYTVWWVIFNNPSNCSVTPCVVGDLGSPAVNATVYNASGAIAAANGYGGGVLNISFQTQSGNVPEGIARNTMLPGNGLAPGNGHRAEVHIVVQDHAVPAGSWVVDLTTPTGSNHRVATFLATP